MDASKSVTRAAVPLIVLWLAIGSGCSPARTHAMDLPQDVQADAIDVADPAGPYDPGLDLAGHDVADALDAPDLPRGDDVPSDPGPAEIYPDSGSCWDGPCGCQVPCAGQCCKDGETCC